jgi:hypothetical protein
VARFGDLSDLVAAYRFGVSDFDFSDHVHGEFSDGEFLGHFDGDLTDPHGLGGAHLVPNNEFDHFQSFDLAGADPDEGGLWDQLQSDLHDGANPYAA